MKRGEIWWADLPVPHGSEPGFSRPALIISDNRFNDSALRTVVVAVISSNMRLADHPGNVALPARGTGLDRPSVINVTQVTTLDRSVLRDRIGRVPDRIMTSIDDGLRLALSL